MNWLNALASLIDMGLALCIDWISLSYDKDRRATDERETARARQGASLEAARAAAQAEAESAPPAPAARRRTDRRIVSAHRACRPRRMT